MGFDVNRDLFIEEANDLLRQIEEPLLSLLEEPENMETVGLIFRILHTIKGSGAMFGFNDIAAFTHDLENIFDLIRKGKISASREIVDLTLQAKDRIKAMIDGDHSAQEEQLRREILEKLSPINHQNGPVPSDSSAPSIDTAPSVTEGEPFETSDELGKEEKYSITFAPDREILLRGVRIEPLLKELSSLGAVEYSVMLDGIPLLDEINAEHCYVSWELLLSTTHSLARIQEVFIFVEDYAKIEIKHIPSIVSEKKNDAVETVPEKSTSESDSKEKSVFVERRKSDSMSIRVKNDKLDTLVNLVGELVTLHARLSQESNSAKQAEFISIAESLGRLTAELRDNTMSIRMVPLSETFNSFNRLIFDLSKNLGKKIRIISIGGETELDKNVIEDLRDPLMHLIRNAADHGLENVEKRLATGKDETGIITLSAEHAGSSVIIRITDDGAGLNRDKILARAIERGLIVSADVDDKTVYQAIFEPGFSTAEKATDISGRGVGMDVVKKNVEKLRGQINIESTLGKGTTISLSIPLTLAIIDGFMVELGGSLFVFNLSSVRECVEYDGSIEHKGDGQFVIKIRGDIIPCIDLRMLFAIGKEQAKFPKVVIIELNGEKFGYLVDRVIGKYQTVVKPIGRGSQNTDMIAGATILGDGSVALILDASAIVKRITILESQTTLTKLGKGE